MDEDEILKILNNHFERECPDKTPAELKACIR
jgi:hypothetical protein